MTVTASTLIRAAAVAAVAAGVIFIGVQIGHPHADVANVTSTEWVVRNSLKVVMAALVLVGISGMYLRQVTTMGVLGLIGYVTYGAAYLSIMCTTFVSAYVLPSLADTDPGYVTDVLNAGTGRGPVGDIGVLGTVLQAQGFAYLGGGVLFGIALFRAGLLLRWAAVLLGISGLVSAALAVMPDAFYRFLAFPNAIAMIALGYSLWRVAHTQAAKPPVSTDTPRAVATAGAE